MHTAFSHVCVLMWLSFCPHVISSSTSDLAYSVYNSARRLSLFIDVVLCLLLYMFACMSAGHLTRLSAYICGCYKRGNYPRGLNNAISGEGGGGGGGQALSKSDSYFE